MFPRIAYLDHLPLPDFQRRVSLPLLPWNRTENFPTFVDDNVESDAFLDGVIV